MKREEIDKMLHDKVESGEKVSPILPSGVKNYLIDIDGTITDDVPNEEPERMSTCLPFEDALNTCNKWFDDGHMICFFTSRVEEHRLVTENWLAKHGFKYHSLLMGKPRGGNYHWIDNHLVRATRYKGKFTDLVQKEVKAQVFDD
ncbi:phosphoheptose isomerase [Flavobacteriaceae bacterium]|nr:phosphoheptose isomerase [Flavobacteriales bacterium]MBL6877807.1 phosphoheptose isomerase [Flavobacteriaceae bacterium]MDA8626506.1 phosphoheptose isomerase [Flavobacteriaceae bacterium]MDA9849331.1 phosphoheptose isomerase [Flavobacteriaceae bacterium]